MEAMMYLRNIFYLVISIFFIQQCSTLSTPSTNEQKQALKLFETYTQAFNSGDIPKLVSCFSDDFAWISIKPRVFETLLRGKAQLIESYDKYYKTYPNVKTKLLEVIYDNGFIWTKEKVSWSYGKEKQEEFIQAVYFIEKGKIQRLWYFEPPDETDSEEKPKD